MNKYVKEAEDETGVKFTVSLAEDGALMIHADGVICTCGKSNGWKQCIDCTS